MEGPYLMGTEFQLRGMKCSGGGVMASGRCERPRCRTPKRVKAVNTARLALCTFHHDLKRKKLGVGRKGSERKGGRAEGRKQRKRNVTNALR